MFVYLERILRKTEEQKNTKDLISHFKAWTATKFLQRTAFN